MGILIALGNTPKIKYPPLDCDLPYTLHRITALNFKSHNTAFSLQFQDNSSHVGWRSLRDALRFCPSIVERWAEAHPTFF